MSYQQPPHDHPTSYSPPLRQDSYAAGHPGGSPTTDGVQHYPPVGYPVDAQGNPIYHGTPPPQGAPVYHGTPSPQGGPVYQGTPPPQGGPVYHGTPPPPGSPGGYPFHAPLPQAPQHAALPPQVTGHQVYQPPPGNAYPGAQPTYSPPPTVYSPPPGGPGYDHQPLHNSHAVNGLGPSSHPQAAPPSSVPQPQSPQHTYIIHEKPAYPTPPAVVYVSTPTPAQPAPQPQPQPAVGSKVTTAQPAPTADMAVKGLRNARNKTIYADGTREWSFGMFDCTSPEGNGTACCIATFCPCIIYAQNKARLAHLSSHDSPDPQRGGPPVSGDCAIHACLTVFCAFGWALQISTRAATRQRYKINGTWLGDCFAAMCCTPCELAQESEEIGLEENSFPEGVGGSTGRWHRANLENKKAT